MDLLVLITKEDNINSSWTSLFFCNVKNSSTLKWEINEMGIGNFSDLEDVNAGTLSNFLYSANLLSLRNMGQFLDSVLVVIAPTGSIVRVNCVSNNNEAKYITNLDNPLNTEDNEPIRNASVNMQPVFLTNTILVTDGKNTGTKAFICGANKSSDLSWEVDTYNKIDHLALDSNSGIGTSYSRLTESRDTLRLQAISLGKHNQIFYSILYVTDDTFEEVRCLAGGYAVKYSDALDTITTVWNQGE